MTDAYRVVLTLVGVFINGDQVCLSGFQLKSLKPVFTERHKEHTASQGDSPLELLSAVVLSGYKTRSPSLSIHLGIH